MVKYCKKDVRLLTRIFKELRKHTFSGINWRAITGKVVCRECGGKLHVTGRKMYTPRRFWHEVLCLRKRCGLQDRVTNKELKELT